MYNQSNRDRFRNIGNKSLDVSKFSEPKGISNFEAKGNRAKLKTQLSYDMTPDSLQLFQEEINSVLKGSRKKKAANKSVTRNDNVRSIPSEESMQIKRELGTVKNMLESNAQLKTMEDRLERLLVQLELQKNIRNQDNNSLSHAVVPQQPYMQQPMYYPYPPQPYYYPPPPPPYYPHQTGYRSSRRRKRDYTPEDSDDEFRPQKTSNKKTQRPKPLKNTRQRIRTRLRIYLFVVAYTFFLRAQAKKLSLVRKSNLKRFWTDKFESQIANMKNWFLDSQKFSLSIILEKKNLNLVFFNQKSERVREEKKKLIMQIVTIGISKILQDSTTQKISLFSEILLNLCKRGSFAVSRFWTVAEMEQICISQYYGFFRVDTNQQKYLIGILAFVKVFIFNMFLQPFKFDSKNFAKKQQPISTNMKLISSVYYYILKEILEEYKNEERDTDIYKVGNWLEVKKEFIVQCSEPLIYGNAYPQDGEYISGLFSYQEIAQLKDNDAWSACMTKMKSVIEKLHTEVVNKGKMVKKNLKYKLYN